MHSCIELRPLQKSSQLSKAIFPRNMPTSNWLFFVMSGALYSYGFTSWHIGISATSSSQYGGIRAQILTKAGRIGVKRLENAQAEFGAARTSTKSAIRRLVEKQQNERVILFSSRSLFLRCLILDRQPDSLQGVYPVEYSLLIQTPIRCTHLDLVNTSN